jgi:hypothetical protein
MRRTDGSIAWAALDLLCCLLLVVYTLIAPPHAHSARIDTQGAYAVVLEWPRASQDDLDLYVEDSAGDVAWYGHRDARSLQLEHDDLGALTGTNYAVGPNYERIVLRTAVPGTYAAVVHEYCKVVPGPTRATVELWKLGTNQRPVTVRRMVLIRQGDQQTAFRWTLDAAGNVISINRLPVTLSQASGVGCDSS